MSVSSVPEATSATCPGPGRPAADTAMRRILCIPIGRSKSRERDAYRLFSTSMVISALRCTLSYVILPILAPLVRLTGVAGPSLGVAISVVALYFDVRGIRRFWLVDHPRRWAITAVYAAVMVLVVVLLVGDVSKLLA